MLFIHNEIHNVSLVVLFCLLYIFLSNALFSINRFSKCSIFPSLLNFFELLFAEY